MQLHAITSVRNDWAIRSKGPAALAVFEQLVANEADLAALGAANLAELFEALAAPSGTCAVAHWDVTSALVRQFHADELVGIGLLAALVPGLVSVARSLSWGRGGPWDDAESFAGDLMATAWTVLAQLGGTTVDYPERRVLERARRRLSEQRTSAQRHAERTSSYSSCGPSRTGRGGSDGRDREFELEDRQPLSVLESLAIALGRLDHPAIRHDDVRLLFVHRVLGYSLAEFAELTGEKVAALKYRRHRAETHLCCFASGSNGR